MKANDFIKKYGIAEAKALVKAKSWTMRQLALSTIVDTKELTKLVKSHELVDSYGGIDAANKTICNAFHSSNHPIPDGHEELSLAIQDVESCQ